jgi:hypothetical protein
MRRPILSGVVAVVLGGPVADARAVEVAVGDGIVVVDLTAEDAETVLRAADSAAAFAALVSPALPAEYQAAVRVAAGGWHLLRAAFKEPIPLRAVITLVPPAVLVGPQFGVPAADVIRTYTELRAKVTGFVPELLRESLTRTNAALRRVR